MDFLSGFKPLPAASSEVPIASSQPTGSGQSWFAIKVVCIVLILVLIDKRASHCVVGTVHLLPSSEIWLCTKSCFMLLSLMKVVPPMTGQCRFCAMMALNLNLWSFQLRDKCQLLHTTLSL